MADAADAWRPALPPTGSTRSFRRVLLLVCALAGVALLTGLLLNRRAEPGSAQIIFGGMDGGEGARVARFSVSNGTAQAVVFGFAAVEVIEEGWVARTDLRRSSTGYTLLPGQVSPAFTVPYPGSNLVWRVKVDCTEFPVGWPQKVNLVREWFGRPPSYPTRQYQLTSAEYGVRPPGRTVVPTGVAPGDPSAR